MLDRHKVSTTGLQSLVSETNTTAGQGVCTEQWIVPGSSNKLAPVQSELSSSCSLDFLYERPITVTDEQTPSTATHVCPTTRKELCTSCLDNGRNSTITESSECALREFYESCVPETYTRRPGNQELTLSYPHTFWMCPHTATLTYPTHNSSRLSTFEMRHLYVKPFFSQAPLIK